MAAFFSILTPKKSDGGTLFASSAALGAPVTNLFDDQPRTVWKTTAKTAQFVELDFGSGRTFDQVYLGFTNFTPTATARIRTANTQGDLTALPDFDSGSISAISEANPADFPLPRGHFFVPLSPSETNRWIRIDLDDSANANAFLTVGRMMVGLAWTPSENVKLEMGYSLGVVDDSPRQIRRDRGIVVDSRTKPARFVGTIISRGGLDVDSEPEIFDQLDEILRARGGDKPILFALEPLNVNRQQKKLFYGLAESRLLQSTLATGSIKRYKYSLTVEEMI